jgi:hypothetical protein
MLFPAKVNFADDRLSERNSTRQAFLHGTCQQIISLSSDSCRGVGKGPPPFLSPGVLRQLTLRRSLKPENQKNMN